MFRGTQINPVYMAVYFRVLLIGCIFSLFCELLLNVCVNNLKRYFGGLYLWPLYIHQYYFPISSEIFAACSRSQCVPSSNLWCHGPLHYLQIRHNSVHAMVGVGGWRGDPIRPGTDARRDRKRKTGARSKSWRGWERGDKRNMHFGIIGGCRQRQRLRIYLTPFNGCFSLRKNTSNRGCFGTELETSSL